MCCSSLYQYRLLHHIVSFSLPTDSDCHITSYLLRCLRRQLALCLFTWDLGMTPEYMTEWSQKRIPRAILSDTSAHGALAPFRYLRIHTDVYICIYIRTHIYVYICIHIYMIFETFSQPGFQNQSIHSGCHLSFFHRTCLHLSFSYPFILFKPLFPPFSPALSPHR